MLEISGQTVTCNFGVNYFYKHFNEITKIDMLVDGLKGIETTKMFDLIPAIYYAGYKAECSKKDVEPSLKFKDFEKYVLGGDEALAAKMINDYLGIIKTEDKPGELMAQAETL